MALPYLRALLQQRVRRGAAMSGAGGALSFEEEEEEEGGEGGRGAAGGPARHHGDSRVPPAGAADRSLRARLRAARGRVLQLATRAYPALNAAYVLLSAHGAHPARAEALPGRPRVLSALAPSVAAVAAAPLPAAAQLRPAPCNVDVCYVLACFLQVRGQPAAEPLCVPDAAHALPLAAAAGDSALLAICRARRSGRSPPLAFVLPPLPRDSGQVSRLNARVIIFCCVWQLLGLRVLREPPPAPQGPTPGGFGAGAKAGQEGGGGLGWAAVGKGLQVGP